MQPVGLSSLVVGQHLLPSSQHHQHPIAASDSHRQAALDAVWRAVVGRTEALRARLSAAHHKLPPAPAIHVVGSVADPEPLAAVAEVQDGCGLPGVVKAVAAAAGAAALDEGVVSHAQAPPRSAAGVLQELGLTAGVLQELGLTAAGERRVAAGASVVWWAATSSSLKPKRYAPKASAGPSPEAVALQGCWYLPGGTMEAVTGGSGVRQGHSTKPGTHLLPPPAARAATCKAALFEEWGALWTMLHPVHGGYCMEEGQDECAAGDGMVMAYSDAKRASGRAYQEAWAEMRRDPLFAPWIPKPSQHEDFWTRGASSR
jgi:hypothetical protein